MFRQLIPPATLASARDTNRLHNNGTIMTIYNAQDTLCPRIIGRGVNPNLRILTTVLAYTRLPLSSTIVC